MLFLTLLVCSSSNLLKSQEPAFRLQYELPLAARDIRVDGLQNLYVLTSPFELKKYDRNGKLLFFFSNTNYGPITAFDPGNPMNILVYHRDFQIIEVLDRSLSVIGTMDLTVWGYQDVPLIAHAQDDLTWIYDNEAARIKKIDARGFEINISVNLAAEFGIENPAFLLACNNYLILADSVKGLFVFDNYAQLYRKFAASGIHKVHCVNSRIFYYRQGKIHIIDPRTLLSEEIALPDTEELQDALWQAPFLYLRKSKSIAVFKKQEKGR